MNESQFAAISNVLDEIEEYLEQRQDVRDGSYGTQLPNTEMSLLRDLRWWRVVIKPSPEDTRASRVKETYREERASAKILEAELRADDGPNNPAAAKGWPRYQAALHAHQDALREFLDAQADEAPK